MLVTTTEAMKYARIEKVNPANLQVQHALTQALWEKLVRQDVRAGSTGSIESFLWADDESAAARWCHWRSF